MTALAILLSIPQFMRPLYRFRMRVLGIGQHSLYAFAAFGFVSIVIATLVPVSPFVGKGPFGYPIVWELLGAIGFAGAFATLILVHLRPARFRKRTAERFVQVAAAFLAHEEDREISNLVDEIAKNAHGLVRAASILDDADHFSAFALFTNRHRLRVGQLAGWLLDLIADKRCCRILACERAYALISILDALAADRSSSRIGRLLVDGVVAESIANPESMLSRESQYGGFGGSEWVTNALFGDARLLQSHSPLGLVRWWGGKVTAGQVKLLNRASIISLKTAFRQQWFWNQPSHFFHIASAYESLSRAIVASGSDGEKRRTDATIELSFGVGDIVGLVRSELAKLDESKRVGLISSRNDRVGRTLIDSTAKLVFEVLEALSSGFRDGHNDQYWSTALDIWWATFPNQSVAGAHEMDAFQKRLAHLIVGKVEGNMKGWYPPIVRLVLALIGAYQATAASIEKTPETIVKGAVYLRLKEFPSLYARQSANALDMLPSTVRFLPLTGELAHSDANGIYAYTKLDSIAPIDEL